MGESATLLRSFSHPSDASREAKEGDPIRALTESISFGRFMSESLAWEKWSTFSHNRYLEEVERFSKPGSVAEKKAYFEAHYKRKAAMRAAALVEEANATANVVPELKTTSDTQNDSPMDTESANTNSHLVIDERKQENMGSSDNNFPNNMESGNANSNVVIDKQWENNNPETVAADSANAEACHSVYITEDLGNGDMERDEALMKYAVNVENLTQANHSKQFQSADVHDKIVAATVEKTPDKEALDQENLTPSSKKRQANSSSKSSTRSGASRLPLYPAKQVPSLPPTNVNNISTNSKKFVGDLNEKRRKIPKTLHMSINFSSRGSETSKASPKMLRDSSTFIPTPTKTAVKGGGVSKHLSKIFLSEDKRNKAFVGKSISGGVTEDGKSHSPMDHSKASNANGTKTRTPNKSSPFSLRSEERAAKRKEFFQKLEEKNNSKEAEKTQLKAKGEHDTKNPWQSTVLKTKQNEYLYHGSPSPSNRKKKQEKAEHEIENLRQSTSFKAKPNEEVHHGGSPSLSNRMKKMLGTQPWSPKLGGKPTSTTVQNTCSRPPRRPSTSTESCKHVTDKYNRSTSHSITSLPKPGRRITPNTVQDTSTRPPWRSSMSTASLKRVIEKNNQNATHSVTSLPKKNARENASPNIQS